MESDYRRPQDASHLQCERFRVTINSPMRCPNGESGGCRRPRKTLRFGASPSGLSFAAVRPRGQGFRRLADRGFPIHRLCASGFGRKRGAPRGAGTVSGHGSTVCVLRRLNSSLRRSMALVVRADFHWLLDRRVKVKSLSPASARLSATALHFSRHLHKRLAVGFHLGGSVGIDHIAVTAQLVMHVFGSMTDRRLHRACARCSAEREGHRPKAPTEPPPVPARHRR